MSFMMIIENHHKSVLSPVQKRFQRKAVRWFALTFAATNRTAITVQQRFLRAQPIVNQRARRIA